MTVRRGRVFPPATHVVVVRVGVVLKDLIDASRISVFRRMSESGKVLIGPLSIFRDGHVRA